MADPACPERAGPSQRVEGLPCRRLALQRRLVPSVACLLSKATSNVKARFRNCEGNRSAALKSFTELGRYELALDDLGSAASLDPTVSTAYANARGLLFSYLGRYDEALKEYSAGGASLADSYNRAVATVLLKDNAGAEAELAAAYKAIEEARATSPARAAYAEAGLAAVKGDLRTALQTLDRILPESREFLTFTIRDVAWSAHRKDGRLRSLLGKYAELKQVKDVAARMFTGGPDTK